MRKPPAPDRSKAKKADVATYRKAKIQLDDAFVTLIAAELVAVVNEVCGKGISMQDTHVQT